MSAIMPHIVRATLNYYLDPAKGGHESFWFGTVGEKRRPFDRVDVEISDIRGRENEFDLDTHGFQYMNQKSMEKKFEDHEKVQKVYYPECVELLKRITGATRVHIMGHVCRRQSWDAFKTATSEKADADRTAVPTSARYVHVDYSYTGAQTRLHFYLPSEAEKLSKSRWAIINIWRPISHTVTRENLAICDARSIPDSDLRPVVAKFRRPDDHEKLSERARAALNRNDVETWAVAGPPEGHRWHYCSKLTPDEALLFKIFDSKKKGVARRSPHSAFVCGEDEGAERQSVEVRCLVFWEDESSE